MHNLILLIAHVLSMLVRLAGTGGVRSVFAESALFGTREIDNRDSEQVYGYMEARIEVLKRRIQKLETEKEALSANHCCTHVASY